MSKKLTHYQYDQLSDVFGGEEVGEGMHLHFYHYGQHPAVDFAVSQWDVEPLQDWLLGLHVRLCTAAVYFQSPKHRRRHHHLQCTMSCQSEP